MVKKQKTIKIEKTCIIFRIIENEIESSETKHLIP